MGNQYSAVMQKKTPEQLLKIINSAEGDYHADAIAAAHLALDSHQLSKAYIQGATQVISTEQEIKDEKANEPTTTLWKALCFVLPGGLQLGFATGFKSDGYYRKASETTAWTFYGIGFYLGLILLSRIIPWYF